MQWQCSPRPGSAVAALQSRLLIILGKINLNSNCLIFQHYFNFKSVTILYAFVLLHVSVNFLCYLFGEIYSFYS